MYVGVRGINLVESVCYSIVGDLGLWRDILDEVVWDGIILV